jgi:hypothetical protein
MLVFAVLVDKSGVTKDLKTILVVNKCVLHNSFQFFWLTNPPARGQTTNPPLFLFTFWSGHSTSFLYLHSPSKFHTHHTER